ncbi:hypothetical protein C0995_002950 [Termitomyces sp. Mi166|nr:hypothetical protein C0995_002950 [Termitomyces sp. Mi166\
MAFGLLEGLLDNWCLLNLDSIKWLCKAEVRQACINLWSLNKQVPWCADFGKMVVSWEHAISTIEQIRLMHFEKMAIKLELVVPIVAPKTIVDLHLAADTGSFLMGKGKAKAMEDDKDKEGKATQKLRKELEDFMVPTKFKGCLWNGIGVRMQKKHPPLAALIIAKHMKLVQVAKAFLKWQGKSSQFFILEGYKGKGKAKALLEDSEQAGTKRSFKSMELVDSNSDKEEEEDRVCIIKKIKCNHVEELTGTRKRKEIIELENEVEIVTPKTPVVGPSCQTSKPMFQALPASKPAAAAALFKPAPVKSAGPAIKGGSIVKDPFMVMQLAGTEESGVLIINQVTEVLVTQETLQDEESSNENDEEDNDNKDGKGDDDDSDNDDVTMDVDSAKRPEET